MQMESITLCFYTIVYPDVNLKRVWAAADQILGKWASSGSLLIQNPVVSTLVGGGNIK